jgi:hypothetical protein
MKIESASRSKGETMKIILAFVLALALCVSASAQEEKETPPVPSAPGVYTQSPSGYAKAELTISSGFKSSGVWKAAVSYGAAKIKGKWIYKGSSAITQLASRRPAFTLVSPIDISTQVVALVRFEIKKDHREAEYCEASVWTGVQMENKDTIPLTVTRIPNTNTLLIVPASDLPAGEYLLVTDATKGYQGYDFVVK